MPQGAANVSRPIEIAENPERGLRADGSTTLQILIAASTHLEAEVKKSEMRPSPAGPRRMTWLDT